MFKKHLWHINLLTDNNIKIMQQKKLHVRRYNNVSGTTEPVNTKVYSVKKKIKHLCENMALNMFKVL